MQRSAQESLIWSRSIISHISWDINGASFFLRFREKKFRKPFNKATKSFVKPRNRLRVTTSYNNIDRWHPFWPGHVDLCFLLCEKSTFPLALNWQASSRAAVCEERRAEALKALMFPHLQIHFPLIMGIIIIALKYIFIVVCAMVWLQQQPNIGV